MMITDELICAMETMIELCKDENEKRGMHKMMNMLLDFDLNKWNDSSLEESDNFIKEYL
jgi:phosphopantothenate synthetase